MKYIYNYLTTNVINKKQYVGVHCGELDDSYLGSGLVMNNAIKKYGRQNFIKEILEICDNIEQGHINEAKYINEYNTLVPHGYNVSPSGGIGAKNISWGKHTDETKLKISEKNKGTNNAMYGKPPTNKGVPMTEEQKQKMRKPRTNTDKMKKPKTEAHKQKMRKPKSEQAKINIGKASKGRIPWNKGLKTNK